MESTSPARASADEFMARAQRAFSTRDLDAIIDLFADDVFVVFADFPPMRGKEQYRAFIEARLARQLDYRPDTTVRCVDGDVIGASWEATWVDAKTGEAMRGRGCEFATLRAGRVAELIVSFNAWAERTGPSTPII